MIETLRTVEHEVGAPAFFRVRHLLRQKRGKFLLAHARPLEGALALELGRRRNHDDGVAAALAAGLEEERNVEQDHRRAARLRFGQKPLAGGADQRMHDCFEPRQRRGIAEHLRGELGAIDFAGGGRAGKRLLDRGNGFAFVEGVHHRVGIVNRHARLGKKLRGPRFAHAERAGQAQDERPLAAH